MTRHIINKTALKVGTPLCEWMSLNMNTKNYMLSEIQLRISLANKTYFAINKILSSRLLSKPTKRKLLLAVVNVYIYIYSQNHEVQIKVSGLL